MEKKCSFIKAKYNFKGTYNTMIMRMTS